MEELERKLKEEREENERLAKEERQEREKEREMAELRQQLQSMQMNVGKDGTTPISEVRKEKVICINDIELLSSLSPAASACYTCSSTADLHTGCLQTRGTVWVVFALSGCVLHSQIEVL